MKDYFECNLPKVIPSYYTPGIKAKLEACVDIVYARTAKLNEACNIMTAKGMRQATFHALAKKVFDNGAKRFDEMSADDLCTLVSLLNTGLEYPDRMEWPNVIVLYDTAFVSTEDWEALRHFGIGGSDSSVVMGVCPYQTEEGLWYDKTGYPELVKDDEKQAIFDRGHFLEPKVIEIFCQMTGAVRIPETRMFQSLRYPHSTANLDSVLLMPSGKIAVFEAKSAIDCYAKAEEWFGSNIPVNYQTQIHQYLGVMNDDRIEGVYIGMLPCTDHTLAGQYIGSEFDPGKYFHHFEEPDPIYEEEILASEEAFWTDFVETGIKPEPSKNSKLDREVAEKYTPTPLSDPNIPVADLAFAQYEDLYNRLSEAEEQVSLKKSELESLTNFRDTLRNEMLAAMEGAQEARLLNADGEPLFIVKNTLVTRDGVDLKTLKEFFPDAYKACRKPSMSTRFSTKAAKPKKKK